MMRALAPSANGPLADAPVTVTLDRLRASILMSELLPWAKIHRLPSLPMPVGTMVTVKLPETLLPALSVPVTVTVVLPKPNWLPDEMLDVTTLTPLSRSDALGE